MPAGHLAGNKAPKAVRLTNGELRIWRSDLNKWLDRLREEHAA